MTIQNISDCEICLHVFPGRIPARARCAIGFLVLTTLWSLTIRCDLFHTRDPQSPSQSRSGFLPPTSPDIVLENLKNSVSERNTDNYIKCFSDTAFSTRRFAFLPTQEAQTKYIGVFRDWDLNSERDYFENLRSRTPTDASSSLFLTGGFQSILSDSALYYADYLLNFQHNAAGIPQQAKGHLQFFLAPDRNQYWSVYRWIDAKVGNDLSWSELKGFFSN